MSDIFSQEVANLSAPTSLGGASADDKLKAKIVGLSDSDVRQIERIRKSLVPGDFATIQEFGKDVVQSSDRIVEEMLKQANSTALEDVGANINKLMDTAREIDASELATAKNGHIFAKILPFLFNTKEKIVSRFNSLGEQIEKYSVEIKKNLNSSDEKMQMLENMGRTCVLQYKQLDLMILTGRSVLEELIAEHAKELAAEKAKAESDPLVLQELAKKEQYIDSLSKRINNLEAHQQVTYLRIPQLAIMVKNVVDNKHELQQIVDLTIPMWKQSFAMALEQERQKRTSLLIKSSKDFTNDMMRRSADELKTTTLEIAQQSTRALVDKQTLEYVQNNLIQTFSGVQQIQQKAREERLQLTQSIEANRLEFKRSLQ